MIRSPLHHSLLLLALSSAPLYAQASPPDCQSLLADLQDRSSYLVRQEAAIQIGEHCRGVSGVVMGLEELLYEDSVQVRQAAAGALAKIPTGPAKKALVRAQANDSLVVRRDLVAGLAEAPDRHLDLLGSALQDEDQVVREHAVLALGEGTSAAVLLHLARAAEHDQDLFVRERAFENIAGWYRRARDRESFARVPGEVYGALRAGLRDSSDRVRVQCIRTLAVVDPQGAVAQIGKLLGDRSDSVRRAVFETLGELGGNRAVDLLEDSLTSFDLGLRRLAVRALILLGPDGVPGLLKALEDPVLEVRTAALEGLPRPAPDAAIPAILERLKDESTTLRREALQLLATNAEAPRVREALVSGLSDTDPGVRRAAVEVSAEVLGPDVVPALESLLQIETDPVVRKLAIETVADIPTAAAANVLGEVLANANQGGFGEDSLSLLLSRHRRFAGGPLTRALPRVSLALKRRVIEELGKLGDPRVAESLLEVLLDAEESDRLRITAARALGKLGHQPALGPIQSLYVEEVHLSEPQLAELQRAMADLGHPAVWPLLLRRHALWLAFGALFLGGFLLWWFVLRHRLAAAEAARQAAHLEALERRAAEPRGPPTEDEFLSELDRKLSGEIARNREVRMLVQRGLLHFLRMDHDQAATDLEEAVRKFQPEDSPRLKARAHYFLAKVAHRRGIRQDVQRHLGFSLKFHDARIQQEVMSEIAQREGPSDLDRNIALLEEKLPFTDDITSVDVYNLKD